MRPNSKLWVSLGTFLDLWDGLWESQPPEGVWPRNECLHIFHWLPVFPNHPVARQGHMTSQWRRGRNDLCPFQLRQWKTQVWLCHLSMAWSKGLRRPPSSSNDAAYKMAELLSAWVSGWLCGGEHSLLLPHSQLLMDLQWTNSSLFSSHKWMLYIKNLKFNDLNLPVWVRNHRC